MTAHDFTDDAVDLRPIIADALDAHDYRTAAEAAWVLADYWEQQGLPRVAANIRGDARRYLVTAWARDVFDPERHWRDVDPGPRMSGEIRRFSLPLRRTALSRYGLGIAEVVFDRRGRLNLERLYGAIGPSEALQIRIAEWWATEQERRAQEKKAAAGPTRDPAARRRKRQPEAEGNENLAYLLDETVRAIGPEKEDRVGLAAERAGIRLFVSPYGSYRFVGFEDGDPVSALQVMSRDGRDAAIANVYTAPAHRRRGWARRLLHAASERFRSVAHSTDLSGAGAEWTRAMGDKAR